MFSECFVNILETFLQRFQNILQTFGQHFMWTFTNFHRVHVLYIVRKLLRRPFQRHRTWWGTCLTLKTALQVIQRSRAHKLCIVGKPLRRPFQLYLTWQGCVFNIYMKFDRWPWRPSDFVQKQTWTYIRPLLSNTEEISKIFNRSIVTVAGRKDRHTRHTHKWVN
jgi:hypothetical protein